MDSLNNQISWLEQMPPAVIGTILAQVNQITDSKGIVNKADIPVVMRYISNLACTSQTMNASINDPIATDLFLKSLSSKYGKSCGHFAAEFNTVGSRKWLWRYINENGDYEAYQVIQNIHDLVFNVTEEAKNAGLISKHNDRKELPSSNPYNYQTRQGFVLRYNSRPKLATPFGEIELDWRSLDHDSAKYFALEVLIKRLNAVFVPTIRKKLTDEERFYLLKGFSGSDNIRKISTTEFVEISIEEMKNKGGSQNLISNNFGYPMCYNIREVNGNKVPEVMLYDSDHSFRSRELIKRIWEMLEAYRFGEDPIKKKGEPNETSKAKDIEMSSFNSIQEVPQWATDLISKLWEQPLIQEAGFQTKLLVLERYDQAMALENLNIEAAKYMDKQFAWPVHPFGSGNNTRSLNGKDLGVGIELWLEPGKQLCNMATLVNAYSKAIKSIGVNWQRAELKDYPDILFTESEEDYVLFVKNKENVSLTDSLIHFLAEHLMTSSRTTRFGNDWKSGKSSGAYLWIKKDSLEMTLKILNIEPV